MSISSIQLDAFIAVAKNLSFSKAAKSLHITQSALSQRIKNLEDDIGITLIIRDPSGIRITEMGERLLRYCQMRDTLEQDLLHDLIPKKTGEYAGIIRIGAFSSVIRSIIIPALSQFLRKNPKVQCDFITAEMHTLPSMMQRAEFDFIVTDFKIDRPNITSHIVGYEDYVVIESIKYQSPEDVYIDNSPDDMATEHFFNAQKNKTPKYRRLFLGGTYNIMTAVEEGLGRAVMPRHLIKEARYPVKVVEGFIPFKRNIILHYFTQSFYPKLHQAIVDELNANCVNYLK